MILKGKSRGNGGQLASYLLSDKNEQVRVLDIRGTVDDDRTAAGLRSALKDMDELGKMTRGISTLFHLAINPNDRDRMTAANWKYSIAKVEQALGLQGQPRAIVSHTYNGKEHFHVVWSRVDIENRKCIEMSFCNVKLCNTAREIEVELGLRQTPQRARGAHKLKQHIKDIQQHQDDRTAQPRAERNEIVKNAWEQSNSGHAFKEQIEAAGYRLAVGDRGVLLVDADNEPHSIARCVKGLKVKDVREKLGELEKELPHIDDLRPARTRQSETGETRSQELARRKAQQTPRAEAKAEGLKEKAADADRYKRQSKDLTKAGMQRELAANDNKAPDEKPKRKKFVHPLEKKKPVPKLEMKPKRRPPGF